MYLSACSNPVASSQVTIAIPGPGGVGKVEAITFDNRDLKHCRVFDKVDTNIRTPEDYEKAREVWRFDRNGVFCVSLDIAAGRIHCT